MRKLNIFKIALFLLVLVTVRNSYSQALVVNEYFNGFSQKTDWIEILVVQNNLDLRNYQIRDFSATGNPQSPMTFSNNPYWANIKSGTLIVITGDSSVFTQDTAKWDFNILLKKSSDTTYLKGTQFNIAVASDAIQIRNNGDTTHVHALIHGAGNINSTQNPRGYWPNSLSGGASLVPQGGSLFFTKPTAMTITDFNANNVNLNIDTTTGGTPGQPNDQDGNLKYILSLRFGSAYNSSVTALRNYRYKTPGIIGTYLGQTIREGSMGSGIYKVPGTANEFWMLTDRGPNIDADSLNGNLVTKVFPFPWYAPKVFRMRAEGDSLRFIDTLVIRKPDGSRATGIPLPTSLGGSEIAWLNNSGTVIPPDQYGIDCEGFVPNANLTSYWIAEEYSPSLWNINAATGNLINRYLPFPASTNNITIDTIVKYKRPNRGFEGAARTPNGKIYAVVQSGLYNPNSTVGNATRLHRILELDPVTNISKTYIYVHSAPTSNIRDRDYKLAELVALNNTDFMLIEQGFRNNEFTNKIFRISLQGATPVTSELVGGRRIEQIPYDSLTAITGIVPVQKTFYLDLNANGWDLTLDKPEGLTIMNDSTFAVSADNDFGIIPNDNLNGQFTLLENRKTLLQIYNVTGLLKIPGLTGVTSDPTVVVNNYELSQNYPNPFNPSTKISFNLPTREFVKLKVYDITGKLVSTLVNDELSSGNHFVDFNGVNLSSGIYFYALNTPNFSETKKMILVK